MILRGTAERRRLNINFILVMSLGRARGWFRAIASPSTPGVAAERRAQGDNERIKGSYVEWRKETERKSCRRGKGSRALHYDSAGGSAKISWLQAMHDFFRLAVVFCIGWVMRQALYPSPSSTPSGYCEGSLLSHSHASRRRRVHSTYPMENSGLRNRGRSLTQI